MKRILALCSVLLALVLPTAASATCEWHYVMSGGAKVVTTGPFVFEFDGTLSQVNANAPKGTVLYSQNMTPANVVGNPGGGPEVACTNYILYWQRIVTTGPATGYMGTYETNIPGVGIRVYGSGGAYLFTGAYESIYNAYNVYFSPGTKYQIELIKTSDTPLTAPGEITGPIAEWRVDQGGPIVAALFRMRTPITIQPKVPTCAVSTPDIIVRWTRSRPSISRAWAARWARRTSM